MNSRDDSNDPGPGPKESTRGRYLRGAKKFEEKKENLTKKKQRGTRRPPRPGSLGRATPDDIDDEWGDEWSEPGSGYAMDPPRRGTGRSSPGEHAAEGKTPNGSVASVARTEVTVLDDEGRMRRAKLTPRVLAAGGLVVGDRVAIDGQGRVTDRGERRTVLERHAPAVPGAPRSWPPTWT